MPLYQRVARIGPDLVEPIAPVAGPGVALGTGLFVTPRTFNYNTYEGPGAFQIATQGLHALLAHDASPPWVTPYADGGHRIVTKADGTMDALPFFQAMAALTIYGAADEGLTHNQRTTTARSRPLVMRCGPVTEFVMTCAAAVGIQTRRVHMLNVTANNNFDDGHVACEAMIGGKWRLFDVPCDTAFAGPDGELLSLAEVIAAGVARCTPVKLAESECGPTGPAWVRPFWMMQFGNAAARAAWLARIYEVPGIGLPNGGIAWGVPAALGNYAPSISGYPGTGGLWTTTPWAQWLAERYP
jgi:hypothetical protein